MIYINYKLTYKEIQIKLSSGLIENNSTGLVEIIIKKRNEIKNKIIEPSGKFIFRLEGDETIWGKSVNRIYANINVLQLEDISSGGSLDPNFYYTKKQIDDKLKDKLDTSSEMTEDDAMNIIKKYKEI